MDSHKHPLITPSASPPFSRSLRSRSAHNVHDRKRQRLDSSHFDLHSARRDSSQKVLDLWSHLADRYSRRLDQDDIIDLRTVSLVKDRGVIRSSPNKFEFGFLTANNSTPLEEDLDELDALASEGDALDKVPPLQSMNPADAEDLRLFLEAEKRRKEQCGELDDDDDENDDSDDDDRHHHHSQRDPEPIVTISDDDPDSDQVADEQLDSPEPDPEVPADLDSEDELGKWDPDEGTKVYLVVHDEFESDSEIEIIEPSPKPSPASSSTSPIMNQQLTPLQTSDLAPASPLTQLQTPPQSSSSVLENTPDDRIPDLTSSSPVKPRPKPKPAYKNAEQPRSTSSPAPKLNLTEAINPATREIPKRNFKKRPKPEVVIPRFPSFKPILLVKETPRSRPSSPPDTNPTLAVPSAQSDSEVEIVEEPPRFTAKEKGKAKAVLVPPAERVQSSESDDPIALIPSSPTSNYEFLTPTKSTLKMSPSSSPLWSPSRKPRPARTFSGRGRKRKRVWSSSPEPPDAVIETAPPESPSLVVHTDDEARHTTTTVPASPSRVSVEEAESSAQSKTPTAVRSAKTTKGGRRRQLSQSHRPTGSAIIPKTTTPTTDITSSDVPFPDFHAHSEPHAPRHDRTSSPRRPRRHSAKYSPPQATPVAAQNPFQDPRAQYIISQAVHQLSCLMTGGDTQLWPPPPLPPLQDSEGERGYEPPPFLRYQHGQWVPYTPPQHHRRALGGSRRRRRHASSSSSHPLSISRSRSRSSSPVLATPVHAFDPSYSGGTLPPSSPDPGPSSSPVRQQPERVPPKSLVGRSKSKGRRVSFRLEDDGGGGGGEGMLEFEGGEVVREDSEGHRHVSSSSSTSRIEALSLRTGRLRARVQMQEEQAEDAFGVDEEEEEEDENDSEEWSHEAAEPARGRRFVRGQTPGPPSRRPSLRPLTPPRIATPSRASSHSVDRRE